MKTFTHFLQNLSKFLLKYTCIRVSTCTSQNDCACIPIKTSNQHERHLIFQFAMFETLISAFVDENPKAFENKKMTFTAFMCFVCFLLGIPCVMEVCTNDI